jgi:hypothetical protein
MRVSILQITMSRKKEDQKLIHSQFGIIVPYRSVPEEFSGAHDVNRPARWLSELTGWKTVELKMESGSTANIVRECGC